MRGRARSYLDRDGFLVRAIQFLNRSIRIEIQDLELVPMSRHSRPRQRRCADEIRLMEVAGRSSIWAR